MTFNLDAFDRDMTELESLSRRQEEILEKMLRDLGVEPDGVVQAKKAPKQRARGSATTRQGDDMATATKQRAVSDEVRAAMMRCVVEQDTIAPPSLNTEKLDRPVYDELKAILESMGGVWRVGLKAFQFQSPRGQALAEAFYTIAETGTWEKAQDYGYFPTPEALAQRMVDLADIQLHHRVLEPSAGRGALAIKIAQRVSSVNQMSTFELLPDNRKALGDLGFVVDGYDFMQFEAGPLFDRIVMNPPFNNGNAPRHVLHAMKLLKQGGKLVAIMPVSIMQRQDSLHRACRAQIMMHGKISPLPEETFKPSGTSVRTVLVEWAKPVGWTMTEPTMALSAPQRDESVPAPVEAPKDPRKPFKRLSKKFRRLGRRT